MPRVDGTGPTGNGPLTGKGMGNCIVRGAVGVGLGLGLGLGCRRGFRKWFSRNSYSYAGEAGKSEKELLTEEIEHLKNRIDTIDKETENQ